MAGKEEGTGVPEAPSEGSGKDKPSPRGQGASSRSTKKAARIRRRHFTNAWKAVCDEACKTKHGVVAQLAHVFGRVEFAAVHGRARKDGARSQQAYRDIVMGAYKFLRELPEGRGVIRIDGIRRKHIFALLKAWIARGLSPKTIQCRISAMRLFLDRIGKPDLILSEADWEKVVREAGIDTRQLKVKHVAEVPLDWQSKGVDPMAKIREIWADCEVVGAQLLMQLEFGARVREAYSTNPFMDHMGGTYHFDKGTKGGRNRAVQLDPDPVVRAGQLEALQRIKEVAAKHPKRYLARKGDTAQQTRNHFYYILKKHGITRAALGITAHGLRHQYLHRRYGSLAGLPAPVHNAAPAEAYRQLGQVETDARLQVSQDAGHWRPDIVAPYAGSVSALTKIQEKLAMGYMALIEGSAEAEAAIRAAGGVTAWLTGKAAQGLAIRDGEPLVLAVLFSAVPSVEAVGAMRAKLQAATGKPFTLSVLLEQRDVPPGALELRLPSERGPAAATAH